MSEVKPYFCPLKTEYYLKFKDGSQDCEIRPLNHRGWNTKNIYPGRMITISKGYGKKDRLTMRICRTTVALGAFPDEIPKWHKDAVESIYGERDAWLIAYPIINSFNLDK